jgi:hypothetical protein
LKRFSTQIIKEDASQGHGEKITQKYNVIKMFLDRPARAIAPATKISPILARACGWRFCSFSLAFRAACRLNGRTRGKAQITPDWHSIRTCRDKSVLDTVDITA